MCVCVLRLCRSELIFCASATPLEQTLVSSQQRIKKLTTPSKDLKMRGKHAALSPYAANDAKLKADGKISTISEKETHF